MSDLIHIEEFYGEVAEIDDDIDYGSFDEDEPR